MRQAGDDGGRDVVLSSPIIMYDHPGVAPESPGDLFDACEIDALRATQPMAGRSAQFDRQFGVPRFAQLLDFAGRENAQRETPLVIDAEIKDPAIPAGTEMVWMPSSGGLLTPASAISRSRAPASLKTPARSIGSTSARTCSAWAACCARS